MDILLRNIDYKTETQLNKLMAEYRNQGIKMSRNDLLLKLIKVSLDGDFSDYKKDRFDNTIELLTNKFEEMIDTNNQLISILVGESEGD